MRFINRTKYKQLDAIASRTEEVIMCESFHEGLRSREEDFKSAAYGINGVLISDLIIGMMKMDENIEIKTYWYWKKKVVGKFISSQPNVIWFNIRNLKHKINDPLKWQHICATIVHEVMHFLDYKMGSTYVFNHGSNTYSKWKEETVQYYCDWLAEKNYSIIIEPIEPTRNIDETWVVKDKEFSFSSWVKSWWS